MIENFLRKQAEAKDTEKSSFLNSMTGIPTANPAKKVNLVIKILFNFLQLLLKSRLVDVIAF